MPLPSARVTGKLQTPFEEVAVAYQLVRPLAGALVGVLLACFSFSAFTQAYPGRPIHIVAPYPAGGGYDFLSRLLGAEMSKSLGQPVVVENKAGANGNVGTAAVAKAAPDGYTLLMGGNSPLALNVGLYKLPYDPVRDFAPISRVATQPNLLAAHPKVPVKSVGELIEYAKANPGKLTYGSAGNASPQHLAAEMLKRMAGIDMLHVPYKGAAPNAAALLAGEVSIAFNIILLPLPQVQAGKLAGLAVASSKRSALAPNIPTMTELGFPIDIDTWYGLLAPAGTPKEIIARLNGETVRILNMPELRERTRSQGIELGTSTPEEFAALIKSDIATWSKVINDLGVKMD
jgi:tripartite-type tricarboxylate transporter receptor subunit TctC